MVPIDQNINIQPAASEAKVFGKKDVKKAALDILKQGSLTKDWPDLNQKQLAAILAQIVTHTEA